MRHGSLLAAAALLFVATSPSTAWAHNWGGGAFIVAFNLMIAVPVGLMGLLVGWTGSGGVKTFVGVLQVLAIAACLVLWMLVIGDPTVGLVGHLEILAPIGLPGLGAWLCLRSKGDDDR